MPLTVAVRDAKLSQLAALRARGLLSEDELKRAEDRVGHAVQEVLTKVWYINGFKNISTKVPHGSPHLSRICRS